MVSGSSHPPLPDETRRLFRNVHRIILLIPVYHARLSYEDRFICHGLEPSFRASWERLAAVALALDDREFSIFFARLKRYVRSQSNNAHRAYRNVMR